MMVMGCLDLLVALLEIMPILIRKWSSSSHGVLAEKDGGHTLEFNSCLPASGTFNSFPACLTASKCRRVHASGVARPKKLQHDEHH